MSSDPQEVNNDDLFLSLSEAEDDDSNHLNPMAIANLEEDNNNNNINNDGNNYGNDNPSDDGTNDEDNDENENAYNSRSSTDNDSSDDEENDDTLLDSNTHSTTLSNSTTTNHRHHHQEHQRQPLPRDHSYLSNGASHPLMGGGNVNNKRIRLFDYTNNNEEPPTIQLAILELDGVVLFPGCTIPVKLRDRSLIQYLGRQIDFCQTSPHLQSEVRLGILTYQHASQRQQEPTRRRRRRRIPRLGGWDLVVNDVSEDEALPNDDQQREHPFLGRIGTIATIQYTHSRAADNMTSLSSRNSWRQYEQSSELVFTAVGTSRFQVLGCQPGSHIDLDLFEVEEIIDEPLPLPPIQRPFLSCPIQQQKQHATTPNSSLTTTTIPRRRSLQSQLTWNLSLVTPIPYFVYEKVWPWKLVDTLVQALKTNNGRGNLPQLDLQREYLEPTKFSFWMASNLPFSESERLELLEMHSTYERLRTIQERVDTLLRQESYICCAQCHTKFTTVTHVFTVKGAEGATSNYVNDHGYIHQITTLRDVDPQKIILDGNSSTENSYFPGYSWTITYCRRCASLLGWKFIRVDRRRTKRDTNPKIFYGFMSSNVVTIQ